MSPAQQPASFSQKNLFLARRCQLSTAPAKRGLTARLKASSQPVSPSYLEIPGLRNHLAFPLSVRRTEKYFSAWGKVSL